MWGRGGLPPAVVTWWAVVPAPGATAAYLQSRSPEGATAVDGVYSYQTSIGLANGQVLRRTQGTLLP
jgi:hypothetical protein